MSQTEVTGRPLVTIFLAGWFVWLAAAICQGADGPSPSTVELRSSGRHDQVAGPVEDRTGGGELAPDLDLEVVKRHVQSLSRLGLAWYRRTPPGDRVTWGGLTACAGLGLGVLLERLLRLRQRKIIPNEFTARFLDRLHEGKLDGGKALDYCEMNPSPAARVALAAVRRWGRPAADLERAVALAHRVESERLRRNVGTLRRVAALAPLLGLLGTLLAASRALAMMPVAATGAATAAAGTAWGPAMAAALTPIILGVVIATLALVAYDGLATRIERLAGELDRLGAETIDAIAMTTPPPAHSLAVPLGGSPRTETGNGISASARTPHQSHRRRSDPAENLHRSSEYETD